jgi:Cd2+/Zn2+-exporting ATPase
MDDDIRKLPLAIKISRRTMLIAKENIVFALAVKFVILVLGALGIVGMWFAVFGDVGVLIIAVLNSTRALRKEKVQ